MSDGDANAPVRSSATIPIGAPPEVVWDVLTRLEDWPEWNPDVKSMSFAGPLAPGSEFRWKAGPGTIVSTIEHVEPPRVIRWRGKTMSIKAIHEWHLEPLDGGTLV
ncbi:MAG: SRPBCC family protein, partial [Gaiellaceae bacterium]